MAVVAVALACHLWGIRRDLPYLPETDEPFLVEPVLQIASSGDPDPRWFGHPGSTMIYPLVALVHLWNSLVDGGPLLRHDPQLAERAHENLSPPYLLGRLLTTTYAVLSLPLVYCLGHRAFGAPVGLLAAWVTFLSPLEIDHAQMVRTDGAGMFFTVLALWLCYRLYDRPTPGRQLAAGLAIGLGVATRYFLVTLLPVLLAIDLALVWRARRTGASRRAISAGVALGLIAAAVGFAASTPYFFLDWATAWRDVQEGARSSHPGADGLSPAGNLAWYLWSVIPESITPPLAALAVAGVALVLWRREAKPLLLLLFAVTFLAGISASGLHWARWIIPLLPVLALLASLPLVLAGRRLLAGSGYRGLRMAGLAAGFVLVSAWPMLKVGRYALQATHPSTRLRAREWIVQNLPPGSKLAAEWHSVPLAGTSFDVSESFSLAAIPSLAGYRAQGYRFLVANSDIYWRFVIAPDRYPTEAIFYRDLFRRTHLLVQIQPSATSRGPIVRVYELPAEP